MAPRGFIRCNSQAKRFQEDYRTLLAEHRQMAAEYQVLTERLKEIEALERDVRYVLGLPEKPSRAGTGESPLGQGGEGDEGLALDENSTLADLTTVTRENDFSAGIEIAEGSVGRAQQLLASLMEIRDFAQAELEDLATTPSIVPIEPGNPYWFSSGFGMRKSPFTGRPEFHGGLDISAREGTPVIAPADGVIIALERDTAGLGNAIKIRHNESYETVYGHLREKNPFAAGIRVGTQVKRGQVIGYVGDTGRSTAPHLHYEIRRNGERVNPWPYLLDR
ncbi:MAG: hypothetical protein KatS3mg115_2354 [Candidatus Poribacteria bacterium]|nr:MAG: hypothetical protein KatS3mg115_2354 [Candidatus Poribacteria bacterium]